jgi:hypothetical protein
MPRVARTSFQQHLTTELIRNCVLAGQDGFGAAVANRCARSECTASQRRPIANRPQLNKLPYKADMLEINQAWR